MLQPGASVPLLLTRRVVSSDSTGSSLISSWLVQIGGNKRQGPLVPSLKDAPPGSSGPSSLHHVPLFFWEAAHCSLFNKVVKLLSYTARQDGKVWKYLFFLPCGTSLLYLKGKWKCNFFFTPSFIRVGLNYKRRQNMDCFFFAPCTYCIRPNRWSCTLPQDATCHKKTKTKLVLVRAFPSTRRPVCCQRALLISKSDCSEVWAGRPAAELSELSSMAAVRRRRRIPEGLTILFNNTAREKENEDKTRPTLYATT